MEEGDWLANVTPDEAALSAEGILLLGVQRDGSYLGVPGSEARIEPGDTVVLYGREERLRELSERGLDDEQAHRNAVDEHEAFVERQGDGRAGE